MGIYDMVDALAGRRPRKNHRELSNRDDLKDIAGIPLDHFWLKVEENLPDDWAFGLFAYPDPDQPGRLVYQARAELIDEDHPDPPSIEALRSTPERAIEALFYSLRDGP